MDYKILIAEDDCDIAELVTLYLESEQYQVVVAENGMDAYRVFTQNDFHLVVVDLMMPGLNGFDLIKRIRETSNVPIIIVSAKHESAEKVLGLNIGADDYVTKPFNPLELVARIQSNLRRYYQLGANESTQEPSTLRIGELLLDTEQMIVKKAEERINLTLTEFKILQILMRSPGRIYTKMQLYELIYGGYFTSDDNTMMVHISNLREKIEDDTRYPKYIKTIRGVGYKIEKET